MPTEVVLLRAALSWAWYALGAAIVAGLMARFFPSTLITGITSIAFSVLLVLAIRKLRVWQRWNGAPHA